MVYDCCVRQKKCRSILKHVLTGASVIHLLGAKLAFSDNRPPAQSSVTSLSSDSVRYVFQLM